MLRVLGWLGLYVGAPTAATWWSAVNLSFVDHFVMFFLVSMAALVVAIVPRLSGSAARSVPAKPESRRP
jgi:Na+/H+ antiporter NhaD/arsenite permease-like protein